MSGSSPARDVAARYEFRVFLSGTGALAPAIRRRASFAGYREGPEVYLLFAGREDLNLKIRGGALDFKRLVDLDRGLQQWQPAFRLELPTTRSRLDALRDCLPADGDDPLDGYPCTAAEIERRFAGGRRGPAARRGIVRVFKQRLSYRCDDCAVELVEVVANGARLSGAAVESTDPGAVLRLCADLGLHGQENVSYVLALSRLLGWIPPPDSG